MAFKGPFQPVLWFHAAIPSCAPARWHAGGAGLHPHACLFLPPVTPRVQPCPSRPAVGVGGAAPAPAEPLPTVRALPLLSTSM